MTYAQTTPAVTPEEVRRKLLAAMDRATARAIEQSEAGIRPILSKSETSRDGLQTLQRWVVPSRTEADTFHVVTLICDCDGLRTECTCPAGQAETPKPCWHRALARRCALKEAPYVDSRQPTVAISLSDLHGRPSRNVVLTDDSGAGVQPAPWPATDDAEAFAAVV